MAKLMSTTLFCYVNIRVAKSHYLHDLEPFGGGRGGGVRSTQVIIQNVCGRFFNSRVARQHLLVLETVVEPAFGVQRWITHGIPVY